MKILKKIFGFKFTVYVWMIAIAIFVFIELTSLEFQIVTLKEIKPQNHIQW